jgi:adenylate cyclase
LATPGKLAELSGLDQVSDRNFFAELKRRNVVRMAGLYLVGAWLLVQVASTVLPMFGAPDWLPRSIVIVLAIGFIPVLIFSWVFEVTPEGLKRDADVAPERSIAPQTARRMDQMIIAVLVLALGYFAFDKFVLGPRQQQRLPNDLSIAVLPFVNMSSDKTLSALLDKCRTYSLPKEMHSSGPASCRV